MIFDEAKRHFFRYQRADEARSNLSTPSHMLARVGIRSSASLPIEGDVIWVLARVGTESPGRYRFIYAFVVDRVPGAKDGWHRFEGSMGLWLADSSLIGDFDWFTQFFEVDMGKGGTSIRLISDEWVAKLRALYDQASESGDLTATLEAEAKAKSWPEDAIRYGAIKNRRGQSDFRARLLEAYGRRCCISGCRVEALLEAAHIRPHAEEPNYDTRNGLLLRADLHTLYDLHLLGVDEYGSVVLSPEANDLHYKELVSKAQRITPPNKSADRPSEDDRRERMALFRRGK
jgi:HNH endonuclease